MRFKDCVQNKVTEFTCRHGDDVCNVTYEYDIESIDDVIKAFNMQLAFLGYPSNTLKEYYKDEILSDADEDWVEDEI